MDQPTSGNFILVTREPSGIANVTINRPRSLNSLTKSMLTDLACAFKGLDADDSVKVIVLSGAGRAFCSGIDLTAAEDVFKGDVKDVEADPVVQMERCRKPIIGAIAGFAVTGGFEIALACDILIAAKGAKFIDTHARFGIFPSWGLSQKLSRIIGINKAREISLTAMPLSAEQAEKLGFVNHVVEGSELLKKAHEVAAAIIKNNYDLVLRYKSVMNDGIKLNLGDALALEKEKQIQHLHFVEHIVCIKKSCMLTFTMASEEVCALVESINILTTCMDAQLQTQITLQHQLQNVEAKLAKQEKHKPW